MTKGFRNQGSDRVHLRSGNGCKASISVVLGLRQLPNAILVLEVKFSHDYLNLFHVVIEIRFGLKTDRFGLDNVKNREY